MRLTYDATYGKWVSDEFPLFGAGGNGTKADPHDWYELTASGSAAYPLAGTTVEYKKYYDAGLRLQVRTKGIFQGTNVTAFTTQYFVKTYSVANYDASSSRVFLETVNTIGIGTTSNAWWSKDSGWGQLTTDGSSKDLINIQWVWDTACAQTMYAVAEVTGRWVSQ